MEFGGVGCDDCGCLVGGGVLVDGGGGGLMIND